MEHRCSTSTQGGNRNASRLTRPRPRMTQARKKLKRRIVLGVMVVCAGVLGVLCVVGDARRGGTFSLDSLMGHDGSEVSAYEYGLGLEARNAAQEAGERILSSSSCTDEVDSAGLVVLYVVGILYSFLGLAIVADEFFQSSLEAISERLKLTPDVAGATFLAAGSSSPELFTSVADAFGEANSTGTGTIVGSAMFNILVIVALSAAVAGRSGASIHIDWRPVSRDVIFYCLSIVILTLVFLDSEVQWWEGLIMTLSYGIYILFMKYNARIWEICQPPKVFIDGEEKAARGDVNPGVVAVSGPQRASLVGRGEKCPAKMTPFSSGETVRTVPGSETESVAAAALTALNMDSDKNMDAAENGQAGDACAIAQVEAGAVGPTSAASEGPKTDDGDEEPETSRFEWPKGSVVDQALFILSLPLQVAFAFTIPDCAKPKFQKFYVMTFLMSLVWIGTLTHFMVEWANAVGCYAGVSPIFMGLVVLAVGTSVPDALGSMIAARGGEANMAIANAVGSNVFDVLIGLGFPWFLRGVIYSEAMDVDRDGIELNVIILFCTAILFVLVLALNKWSMNTKMGFFLFFLYLIYVTFVIVRELV